MTELQVGSYVFMDAAYARVVGDFAIGLTVATTVVSRHGRRLVLDAGLKTVSTDFALPEIIGEPGATPRWVAEEHAVFDVPVDCQLDVGDRVELVSGHCCATVNLHDAYLVVQDDGVVDVWHVLARGPGRGVRRRGSWGWLPRDVIITRGPQGVRGRGSSIVI